MTAVQDTTDTEAALPKTTATVAISPSQLEHEDTLATNDSDEEELKITHSIWKVLSSKFVVGQLIFNVLASLLGPLGTFYLLFGYLSEGPYEWYSGPLVGVVVGSLIGSPVLIFALMPVGIPEAVTHDWFPTLVLHSNDSRKKSVLVQLLYNIWQWEWGTKRNLAIGFLVGIFYVPIALLAAYFGFGPTMDTWTLIWFNVVYEVLLAIPVVLLGLVGYSVQANQQATLALMSNHTNTLQRFLSRCWVSLKISFCPAGGGSASSE